MKIECIKCNGTGYIGGCDHIWSGRCFTCGGSGKCDAKTGNVVASGPTMRMWDLENCTVTELVGRFEVQSKTGAIVLVWADGYAVACDSVKNKAAAEAWASRLLMNLLAA